MLFALATVLLAVSSALALPSTEPTTSSESAAAHDGGCSSQGPWQLVAVFNDHTNASLTVVSSINPTEPTARSLGLVDPGFAPTPVAFKLDRGALVASEGTLRIAADDVPVHGGLLGLHVGPDAHAAPIYCSTKAEDCPEERILSVHGSSKNFLICDGDNGFHYAAYKHTPDGHYKNCRPATIRLVTPPLE